MAGEPVQRRLQFVLEKFAKRPTENVVLNYFGMANEVYTITTAEGRFVVKNCFKNDTLEKVSNEVALIQFLQANKVATPALVPTTTGELFLNYDDHFYLMTEFLPGYTPTWEEALSLPVLSETMRAMANFHQATEHFKPPYQVARISSLDTPKIKQWLQQLQTDLQCNTEPRQSVDKMKGITNRLLSVAEDLQQSIAHCDLSVLKKVTIHGDIHCFNLIFNEAKDRYIGVIDFDFSAEDYRLVDFLWASRTMFWGYWLPTLFGEEYRHGDTIPSEEQIKIATKATFRFMVDEYRKHHDLSEAELRLLPLFVKALPLYTVRFFQLSNSEEECLSHAQWFTHQLEELDHTVQCLEVAIDDYFSAGV